MTGNKLTLADFLVFNEVVSLSMIGNNLEKYPKVRKYMDAVSNRNPVFVEINKPVEAIASKKNHQYMLSTAKL